MNPKDKKNKKKAKPRFLQMDISDFLGEEKANSKKDEFVELATEKLSAGVPFDSPLGISFVDKYFCLSGRFDFGVQAKCAEVISRLRGKVQERVTSRTDYLIVGKKLNHNWSGKYYGLKIQNALARKLSGGKIRLLQEADLAGIFPPNPIGRDCEQMAIEDFLKGDENES